VEEGEAMTNEPDNTSDLTQDLSAVEMLRLVLADVRDIKARVSALEAGQAELRAIVDDRLKDTRPIWQAINERTERIEEEIRRVRREMGLLREDIRGERMARVELAERVDEIERKPN
jgi:N-methylhydantoinase B/oxoprolinase/acetone carboxylase alpha subunit